MVSDGTDSAQPGGDQLPRLPTLLIGRARDLSELSSLLADPRCRLLTLVGPGGIGKTRLAIAAAAVAGGFAHGVYFVELQPVQSLLAAGRSNDEIARELIVAVGTVKAHTSAIYRKLDVDNRAHAVLRARELGLLD